ncbi:MAG TPA: PH domain-containing protein [Gemmatimonadaceae bacterium]|nr:PH domain-containing protein [Gemmatimonadaceae bacterium]
MGSSFTSQPPDEVFRSRVDAWLVVLVLVIAVGGLGVAMANPNTRAGLGPGAGTVIAGFAAAAVLLLFRWSYRSTTYVLGADALVVRCAGMRWRVPYGEIRRVEYTSNPISSPALSLRRLAVSYGAAGWLLVSPTDRAAFVAALARRVPGLEVRGG